MKFAHKNQNGAVLIISLIFLIVLTILAVASTKSALFQEKISGNSRNLSIAFQAAEAGLRLGEDKIAKKAFSVSDVGGHELTPQSLQSSTPPIFDKPDKFSGSQFYLLQKSEYPTIAVTKDVKYAVVKRPVTPDPNGLRGTGTPRKVKNSYHIYSRGYGADGRTQVIVTSTYRL